MYVPREMFFTKGVGRHKERLSSFEEALRDAKIANLNIVTVSSIFPPGCKIIPRERGLARLKAGQIAFVVLARNETNEHSRLIAASVGCAIPKDRRMYGYLSEHHPFGETEEESGEYAEDLAASMLATVLGVEFDPNADWDSREQTYKISGKIVSTRNITQSAEGHRKLWTTVIAAAVLLP
ncbi:MAG: arginine decarboxylase, pyruvoyl-dependent [Planctomycetales bacterium]|nr:arginine decarboxylase, pyruvoyl-dependent [Planctomycetales bacterium]